jgi:hypothetical protein
MHAFQERNVIERDPGPVCLGDDVHVLDAASAALLSLDPQMNRVGERRGNEESAS